MISTTPTVAEIDAAINVLSILEMAKDASKLKDALAKIKEAKDEAKAMNDMAAQKLADISTARRDLDSQQAIIESQQAKLREANQIHLRNNEDLAADRAAMREERDRFDRWMAEERNAVARLRAQAEADKSVNDRRGAELQAEAAQLDKIKADLAAQQRAADALRAEYEQKIASLKAMVGQ